MTSLSRPSIRTFVYLAILFAFIIVMFFLYSFGVVSEGEKNILELFTNKIPNENIKG